MQIKLKYVLIFTSILLFCVGGLIWYVSYLNKVITDRENTIAVQRQNEAALQDYITMQADSIQDYSIYVKDLQKDNLDLNKKYVLLRNKYYILIDSIKVLNAAAEVDTSGNTIVVKFEGRQGKVTYKGHTTYFKLTSSGTYSIQIGVEPSKVESEVYLDKEKNLIKNKIYIDGALIDSAKTEIDSSLYILIKNNKLECPDKPTFFDRLHILVELGTQIENQNGIYTPKKVYLPVGMEYQFDKFRILGKYDIINRDINVGIQYHPSIKDLWKAIF